MKNQKDCELVWKNTQSIFVGAESGLFDDLVLMEQLFPSV